LAGGAYIVYLKVSHEPIALVDPDATTGDGFGTSVAVNGKYIVVGAPERTVSGQAGVGAVVIFDAKTHVYLGTIQNPNFEAGSRFGASLALGKKYLAVGAPTADRDTGLGIASDIGRVYEFTLKTRAFARELLPNISTPGVHFGASMSTDGKTLLVGVPDDPVASVSEGSTSSYLLSSGAFIRENVSAHPVSNGQFGAAVSVMQGGNYLVGAPGEQDDLGNNVGRAYLFQKFTARAR
jgi:hypothetical protein